MDSTCMTIIGAMATAVVGLSGYVAKLWSDKSREIKDLNDSHAKEVKELNGENKEMLREMLKEFSNE